MTDPVLRSFCPDGGVTAIEITCPATPSRSVMCSVHGVLGHGDSLAVLYRHAGVPLPPDSALDDLSAEIRRRIGLLLESGG